MKVRGFEKVSYFQWENDCPYTSIGEYYKNIKLPKRATKDSAGYDIFSPFDFELYPGAEIKIPLGIRTYMQSGEFLAFYPRSGSGFKNYIRLANTTAIIDRDYYFSDNEGHVWLKIRNESAVNSGHKQIFTVKAGDAICQGIFQNFLLEDGDDFENGNIRNGGFDSTNKI